MNLEAARKYILERLDSELPVSLSYHSPQHTRDVAKASMMIGRGEGFKGEDMCILETAAYYHDSGFLYQYNNHEEHSCHIARQNLPNFGYSEPTITLICEMIMATKIPQDPKTKLAAVLCDADLDYLGTEGFYKIGNQLFAEFVHYGVVKDEMAWNRLQARFLENHNYFTQTAKKEREARKQMHLQEILRIIAEYES